MSDAREQILGRIRNALPPRSDPDVSYNLLPRTYLKQSTMDWQAVVDLFIDRLLDYNAAVLRVNTDGEIGSAVEALLGEHNETHLVTPASPPPAWLPGNCDLSHDEPLLSIDRIESAQAVLTGCELAIAATGTIILRHTRAQGRRVLTLLPDHHLCVVRREQIVESLPEAFARMTDSGKEPWTSISGPSATSDIEMTRIRGVHGPRRLSVVLIG